MGRMRYEQSVAERDLLRGSWSDAYRSADGVAPLPALVLKKNGDHPFSVLLGAGGELVAHFEELADT